MTKRLEDISGGEISVQETQPVLRRDSRRPEILRAVMLASSCKQPLLYAESSWSQAIHDEVMIDPELPIWYNLQNSGITPTRNIKNLFFLICPELQMRFGSKEKAFLGREYVLLNKKQQITTIIEILNLTSFL